MLTIPPPKDERRRERPKAAPRGPMNANLLLAFMTYESGIFLLFDGPVTVDPASPPTTWSFNGQTSIQGGCVNYGTSVYLIINGIVNPGDPVVFAANDPAARTPGGGYVNAASMTISDM